MKETIGRIYPLTERLELLIEQCWRRISLPANSLLLTAGDVNSKLYFMEKGLARAFYEKEGQEYTSWFVREGDFLYSVDSFLNQIPSIETIQLIEPSTVWFITYDDWQYMLKTYPETNYIVRVLMEKYLLLYDARTRAFRGTTPKERLSLFLESYADLYNRLPLKYIASYMDISASTLSRVRSQAMKEGI